jgi:hypothetical protein
MDKLLFRCHNAGALLTEPKLKSEAGQLSQTAKTMIEAMWLKNTFGYREMVTTDAMTKGLRLEQESMALAQQVLGGAFRSKNRETLKNEFIIGTPDIILTDYVEDIKTCYNLRTFFEAEPTKLYLTQAQCYMALTGRKYYRLIYCLVPNTDEAIIKECERVAWQYGRDYENQDYIDHCTQIKQNNDCIKSIPPTQRVKVFEFSYDETVMDMLYRKVELAREYYLTLKL